MSAGIYWIASYPKSGNTWLRVFLANLLADSAEPVDINRLAFAPPACARRLFDEHAGVEASELLPEEVERLRPAVYERLAAEAAEPLHLKTHEAFTPAPDGGPRFPAAATLGAVYMLRDPRDVAVSFAHHFDVDVDTAIGWMADEGHCLHPPHALGHHLPEKLLSWSGHVTSWLEAAGLRLHVVRYEDFSGRPEETFTAAARFLGAPSDRRRVGRALEASRFDELRRQEKEHGFRQKYPLAESFFRRGEVGAWRRSLSPAQAARLVADHAPVMRRCGYDPELA